MLQMQVSSFTYRSMWWRRSKWKVFLELYAKLY